MSHIGRWDAAGDIVEYLVSELALGEPRLRYYAHADSVKAAIVTLEAVSNSIFLELKEVHQENLSVRMEMEDLRIERSVTVAQGARLAERWFREAAVRPDRPEFRILSALEREHTM